MVSSMARILSSGGVHVSLLAVSATERVDMTLDMTLAVAEAINPDKPNQTEDFHKTPRLEDTPCTWCILKLNLSLQSKCCGSAG